MTDAMWPHWSPFVRLCLKNRTGHVKGGGVGECMSGGGMRKVDKNGLVFCVVHISGFNEDTVGRGCQCV